MRRFFDRPGRVLAMLLLPTAALAALGLARAYQASTQLTLDRRAALTHLAATTLAERFSRLSDLAVSMATRVQFRKSVSRGRWTEAIAIMRDVPRRFPFIDRVTLSDPSGIQRADTPALLGAVGLDISKRDWFQGARESSTAYISDIFKRTVQPRYNVVALSVPVRGDRGRLVGVLMFQIRLATFFDWSRDMEVGPSGYAFFVDRKGHPAGHPRYKDALASLESLAQEPGVREALAGRRGVEVVSAPGADARLIAYESVQRFGWSVVAEQPTAQAFAARNQEFAMLAAIYGLFLALEIALGLALMRLINRYRSTSQALHRSEERFRLLTSGVKDYAIVALSPEGYVLGWNEGAERIKGYREDEIIGKHMSVFYTEESVREDLPARLLRRAIEDGRVEDEGWRLRKDGSRFWADVIITPMKDRAGTVVGFSKVTRDLTERKRADEELRALNKELEAFSYTIAHDLRAPLRAIEGFSKIVEEEYAASLDAEGRRLLNVVRGNARQMAALIDDLLKFARFGRQTLEKRDVDMETIAKAAFETAKHGYAERPIDFRLSPLPKARGDSALLREVFINLFANAIKYSSKKSRSVIETAARTENGETIYVIKDNGAGFDMRYVAKLFGVFQRLHRPDEFEGTGVGLAIVDKIISRHGGRVWAEAKEGEGATFSFSLPQKAT